MLIFNQASVLKFGIVTYFPFKNIIFYIKIGLFYKLNSLKKRRANETFTGIAYLHLLTVWLCFHPPKVKPNLICTTNRNLLNKLVEKFTRN